MKYSNQINGYFFILPAYYSVRGVIEKAYAGIIGGDVIVSTLNDLNEETNIILADAIAN